MHVKTSTLNPLSSKVNFITKIYHMNIVRSPSLLYVLSMFACNNAYLLPQSATGAVCLGLLKVHILLASFSFCHCLIHIPSFSTSPITGNQAQRMPTLPVCLFPLSPYLFPLSTFLSSYMFRISTGK